MRITKSKLRQLIAEELSILSERTKPGTLKVDPEEMSFSVMATPNRPEEIAAGWEEGEEREISGDLTPYGGTYRMKRGEDLPGSTGSRSDNAQLAAQLGAQVQEMMLDMGYDASDVERTTQRVSKGGIMSDQLSIILSLGNKLRGKADQESLKRAVDAILDIKLGFDVSDPRGG